MNFCNELDTLLFVVFKHVQQNASPLTLQYLSFVNFVFHYSFSLHISNVRYLAIETTLYCKECGRNQQFIAEITQYID